MKASFFYFNRGNVKVDLGDLEGAISDYDAAIDLNPEYASAYYGLGRAFYLRGTAPTTEIPDGDMWQAVINWREAERLGYSLPQTILDIIPELEISFKPAS